MPPWQRLWSTGWLQRIFSLPGNRN